MADDLNWQNLFGLLMAQQSMLKTIYQDPFLLASSNIKHKLFIIKSRFYSSNKLAIEKMAISKKWLLGLLFGHMSQA